MNNTANKPQIDDCTAIPRGQYDQHDQCDQYDHYDQCSPVAHVAPRQNADQHSAFQHSAFQQSSSQQKRVYLDYQASTPCDQRVLQSMLPYFTETFGNPHSSTHYAGYSASDAIEEARLQIAQAIGATPKEILFTSGATEANNLALKGVVEFYSKKHIVISAIEHKCVMATANYLQRCGIKVTIIPTLFDQQDNEGIVDLEALDKAITPDTALVSIMAVQNEIGTIQPLQEIGAICRRKGVLFHTDAAQALGRIPLDVVAMNIDLMSLSAHKIYGPKGIGVLYVRSSGKPNVRVVPIIHGGGQERGMRSGTLPTPLCVGFGAAAEIAIANMESENQHIKELNHRFYSAITSSLSHVRLNGSATKRIPHNLNLSFRYVEGEGLMLGVPELALSSGSACTSASLQHSYVLEAIGVGDDSHTAIRFSFGRFTSQEDVDYAAQRIIETVTRLRMISPLWDMVQQGVDLNTIQWKGH